jgi:methyl-accepting chemotaxis protein
MTSDSFASKLDSNLDQVFGDEQQASKVRWLILFTLLLAIFLSGMLTGQILSKLVQLPNGLNQLVFLPVFGLLIAAFIWLRPRRPDLYVGVLLANFLIFSAVYMFMPHPETTGVVITNYIFYYAVPTLGALGSYRLAKTSQYSLATWLLLLSGSDFIFVRCIQNSVRSPIVASFIVIVVLAVLLMRVREAVGVTLGCVGLITGILILNSTLLPFEPGSAASQISFEAQLEAVLWVSIVLLVVMFLLLVPRREQDKILRQQNEQLKTALQELQARQQLSQKAGTQVLELAAELKISAEQQASGSQEHAATVNQINGAVAEMVKTSSFIAELAQQVNTAVRTVAEDSKQIEETTSLSASQSQQGLEAVNQTSQVSREVGALYQQLQEATIELNNKSSSMQRVLKLISGISGETHLIALNAAIEAAGAGVAGERFRVVAQEVRNLAQRANEASQEVVGIIDEVAQVVTDITEIASEGHEKASRLEKVVGEAGTVIGQMREVAEHSRQQARYISQAARQVGEANSIIESSTHQQKITVTQIMQALQGLNMVAQQNAAGSRQVSTTSTNLEMVSQELNRSLATSPEKAAELVGV